MATMTCLACNVGFGDIDLGRLHYKTDWHRYNLKRKVVNLTPVTLEKFQERQLHQEKQVINKIMFISFQKEYVYDIGKCLFYL